MSRITYDDDCEDFKAYGFQANTQRCLNGRRGQALLLEIEAALLAMPEKELIAGNFVDECGDVCPLGALYVHRRMKSGLTRGEAIEELRKEFEWYDGYDGYDGYYGGDELIEQAMGLLDVKYVFAWAIMGLADESLARKSPAERYERVLGWIRKRIKRKSLERSD